MRATLEFDLAEAGDLYDWESHINATNMRSCLWEIKQYLRNIDKYGCDEIKNDTAEDVVHYIRSNITTIINESGVTCD